MRVFLLALLAAISYAQTDSSDDLDFKDSNSTNATLMGMAAAQIDDQMNPIGVQLEIDFRTTRGCSNGKIQLADIFFLRSGQDVEVLDISVPGGRNPAGEFPARLLDNNTRTKWIDIQYTCAAGIKLLATLEEMPDSYTFTTANDFPERDPITWSARACYGDYCHCSYENNAEAPIGRYLNYTTFSLPFCVPSKAPTQAPISFVGHDCADYVNVEYYELCLKSSLRRLHQDVIDLREEMTELETFGETCDQIASSIENRACN